MRRMALRFVSGDARARIGVWLGWVRARIALQRKVMRPVDL